MRYEAPGLPAQWLNGWLAAIGVTVLVPGAQLSWADNGVPHAVFEMDQSTELAEVIARALPTSESLAASVIARTLPGARYEFSRKVSAEAFRERARLERERGGGSLAASVSDLSADAKLEDLEHGAFDVPVPQGRTLWDRAGDCARRLVGTDIVERVNGTLAGSARRDQLNGLGFDCRRAPAGMHPVSDAGVHVDPVIELLVFSALPMFPVRGDGRTIRQRLWTQSATRRGAFRWTAWRPSLDRWGIDALLDQPPDQDLTIARYRVVPYQLSDPNDRRAYFAERVL